MRSLLETRIHREDGFGKQQGMSPPYTKREELCTIHANVANRDSYRLDGSGDRHRHGPEFSRVGGMRPDLVRPPSQHIVVKGPCSYIASADTALVHRKFVNDVQQRLAVELANPGGMSLRVIVAGH